MIVKKIINSMGIIALMVVMAAMLSCSSSDSSSDPKPPKRDGLWVTGDFHTHTYISDGEHQASEVAQNAVKYGLDWYSAGDHGGVFNRDDAGTNVGNRWRWETIFGEGSDKIYANRATHSNLLQFNAFEFNPAGHEHASVGIVGSEKDARENLALFEYLFDAVDTSTYETLTSEMKAIVDAQSITKNTVNNHQKSIQAAQWLKDKFPNTSYFLPNHPTRVLAGNGTGWLVKEIRELHDLAPTVFFGAELMPGHQKSSWRGGLGRFYYVDSKQNNRVIQLSVPGSANTIEDIVDSYIAANAARPEPLEIDSKADILTSLNANIPRLRTYGGVDYYASKIGGVWDSLLSEGRHFWLFGNSDFHTNNHPSGGESQFWPGEYTKLYTFVKEKTYQGVLDGMRSGNSYSVLGDLINHLDYYARVGKNFATMGERVGGAANSDTVITISFKTPAKNNANADGRPAGAINEVPVVSHIDLIAGEVNGKLATANYDSDSVTTTKVIKTFTASDWKVDKNGMYTMSITLPKTTKNMYYRLRGTNIPKGTAGLSDSDGNPLTDTPFTAVRGTNTAKTAFEDLWFYSNPIFVNAN